jgi:hypothetical protein
MSRAASVLAFVMAGGEGTRLRPLTSTVPKPVVPLVDRPFIAFMLDWLRTHGVEDIVISCGHMASGVRNVLAILNGLAGDSRAEEILQTLMATRVSDPYPIRVVTTPMEREHDLWRSYMDRHQQNQPHQYHNGGIWPFIGGYWVMALACSGKRDLARTELAKLARVNSLDDWRFTEWFHGRTLKPMGMAGQTWNAAAFLLAQRAVESGELRL